MTLKPIAPNKKQIWDDILKLGLNVTQKLRYRDRKEKLERALNRYKKAQEKKREKIIPVDDTAYTEPDVAEEPPMLALEVSTSVPPPPAPVKVPLAEQPEPPPAPVVTDPVIEVFKAVARTVAEPNGSNNWEKWWSACRKRLDNPDSDRVQRQMRTWVKRVYNFTI